MAPPVKDRGYRHPAELTQHQLDVLGLSKAQYEERFSQREQSWLALHQIVTDPSASGSKKHIAQCQFAFRFGKNLVYCKQCWLLPLHCICSRARCYEIRTKVIVHTHHFEWGKGTNTGSVLAHSLLGSQLLMKGLPEHDNALDAVINNPSYTVAVLWPSEDAVLPEELQRIANEKTAGRIAVIAIDATWPNARKMKTNYPASILQVKLPPEVVVSDSKKSLLFPVRKYKGQVQDNGRVSTLEATAALLYCLEGREDVHEGLLHNLKLKVDAAFMQKCMPPIYGTHDDD